MAAVLAALGMSKASRAINTSFVERQNGTDRHRNARKARKTYRFSKDWRYHEAVTYLTMYSYNFCWPVRTLRIKDEQGSWQDANPGDGGRTDGSRLVDGEWLTFQLYNGVRPRGSFLIIGIPSSVREGILASTPF